MHDRPTAVELIVAVSTYLRSDLLPDTIEPGKRYRLLVAIRALDILERDVQRSDEGLSRTDVEALRRRIRHGDDPLDLLPILHREVAAKLAVVAPNDMNRDGAAQ